MNVDDINYDIAVKVILTADERQNVSYNIANISRSIRERFRVKIQYFGDARD